MIRKNKTDKIALLYMISIVISNIFYGILNRDNGRVYSVMIELDRAIPFLEIFIIPYIIWYPFIFIGLWYLCFKDRKKYYDTLINVNIALIISYIIFYFFQTTVLRPELVGDNILTKLVLLIYKHDNPYNCFPSVHVITTYIVMRSINTAKSNKSTKMIANVVGSFIILSTVFVKQHVVMDILGAILLSEIVIIIVKVIMERKIVLSESIGIK